MVIFKRIVLCFSLIFLFTACQGGTAPTETDEIGELYGAVLPSEAEIAAFPKSLHPSALATPSPTETPTSVLLQNTPPIGQQGPCSLCTSQGSPGSCISWSAAYGLGTYTVNQTQNWDVDDPAHQVSSAYMYAFVLNEQGKTCPQGTSDPNYFNFLVRNGSVAMSTVPYEANCTYLGNVDLGTLIDPDFKIGSWAFVSPQDRDLIKAHLAAGQAVAFAGNLYEGFGELQGSEVFYGSGPFEVNKKTNQLVGHGMMLIGYDDDLGDPGQGLGAYRVQNSFGTTWGDSGYLWMSYGTFESSIKSAFVAVPAAAAIGGGEEIFPEMTLAPAARVVESGQWERLTEDSSRVFLALQIQFDEAVEIRRVAVTDPSGETASYSHGHWLRDGHLHFSRADGKSFQSGAYALEIEAGLIGGASTIYSGEVEIAPLVPAKPEAPLDSNVDGGHLRPATID
jgi:hypothetical protein